MFSLKSLVVHNTSPLEPWEGVIVLRENCWCHLSLASEVADSERLMIQVKEACVEGRGIWGYPVGCVREP